MDKNIVLKIVKNGIRFIFNEWQCKIYEETAHVDTIVQIDEPFYMDLDGNIWVKYIDCGWKFHAFCVIPVNDNLLNFEKETLDHLELQGFFMCCMEK